MRIITRRGPRWLAATAALASAAFAGQAGAQYAPYAPAQTQYGAGQAQYGQAQAAYGPAQAPYAQAQSPYAQYGVQTQTPPQYAPQGAYQGYMANQQTAFTQTPAYGNAYAAPRTAMAYQGAPTVPPQAGAAAVAAPAGDLQMTPPAENVAPGSLQNGAYAPIQPTPSPENYGYGPAPVPAYGNGYESYPNGGAGCATGNCATGAAGYGAACNATPYGGCDAYSTHGGMSGVLSKHAGCGYWFGGVYGLLMDRDNSNKYALAFVTDPSMPTAYPPADMTTVLTTRDADIGFQPGVEVRLGRAFGGGDPCGCCCGPTWGLEAVYWTIFEDDDYRSVDNPTGTSRTYTMMPMYGLEYSHPGTGMYMPMNQYWDHGMPSDPANTIRVDQVHVRSQFEVQNLELNLLRFNLCGGGCGGAYAGGYGGFGGGFSSGMGGGCCDGGCDTACDTGACTTGCAPCAPRGPRYSCTAVCGVRWMEFNESFMFGVNYTDIAMPTTSGMADYWAMVDNNLIGGQIGCNGMYRIGCKWGFHLNTLVGVYANDINTRQYFSSTGDVRFIGTGEDFDVMADKTDVAMLGELRIGASYQATCRCRLYGGWRAIGVTGIALATDQSPNAFLSAAQMNNYVNSNGSLILHGLQAGVEFNY